MPIIEPVVSEPAPSAPVARRPRWRVLGAMVSAATAAIVLAGWAFAAPQAAVIELGLPAAEAADAPGRVRLSLREVAPVLVTRDETIMQRRYPLPKVGDAYLHETFPTLRNWIHPVTASDELLPALPARLYGAERAGVERSECGSGHCGIDLDGPRGRPLVAVADGIVIRVERSMNGADGRSGHYVRIQHADGSLTAYMHMDDVAKEMQFGAEVKAGQYIGTLGATAVYSAPPHLHFSLEVPNRLATRMDHTNTHYVDPSPFLVRSRIVPAMDRREPKPAF